MKKEKISQALSNIDIRHIEEAELYSAEKKPVRTSKSIWCRVTVAAAVVVCIASLSIPAVANSLGGFFRDIIRFDGAIVGSSYENATEEIKIEASNAVIKDGNTLLTLDITFLEIGSKEPYIYLKNGEAALGDYRILDSLGKEIYSAKGQQEPSAALEDEKAVLLQPITTEALSSGEKYTLVIESVYGLQKAEQPLKMTGLWECEFTIDE